MLHTVQGKQCFQLDDREVRRLIDLTYAQVQFSSTSTSLYVFLPGRQTFWSDCSETVTVNGLDMAAPGMFFAENKALEPQALFMALGLRAFEERETWQLYPVVTSFGVEGDSPDKRPWAPVDIKPVILKFSAPAKPVVSPTTEEWFVLEIPDVAWDEDLCPRTLQLPAADCEVVGGRRGDSSRPLTLRFKLHPYWKARLQTDLTGSAQVSFEPTHLWSAPDTETVIGGVELSSPPSTPDEKHYLFFLDKATQFTWRRSSDGRLQMEFPAAQLSTMIAAPDPGLPFRLAQLRSSRYPLVRFETKVAEGRTFDFVEISEPPHTLMLRVAPSGKYKGLEDEGMATTGGFFLGGRGATVVIDPGHGGGDPGCRNSSLGVYEKDVNLDISLRLARLLQQRGLKVVMTRTDDRDITYAGSPDSMELQARADVANRIRARVFVSIHCNASVNSGARGSSVYWYKDEDYPLAQSLDVLGNALGFEEQGVLQNRFAVLRLTEMPAALVETAFLTNPTEGAMLADAAVRQAIAERLALGLERYLQRSR